MKTHSGEKPFRCTHPGCLKSYNSDFSLKKHMKTHSDEKPFRCTHPGCFKSFSRSDHLNKHYITHSIEVNKKSGLSHLIEKIKINIKKINCYWSFLRPRSCVLQIKINN